MNMQIGLNPLDSRLFSLRSASIFRQSLGTKTSLRREYNQPQFNRTAIFFFNVCVRVCVCVFPVCLRCSFRPCRFLFCSVSQNQRLPNASCFTAWRTSSSPSRNISTFCGRRSANKKKKKKSTDCDARRPWLMLGRHGTAVTNLKEHSGVGTFLHPPSNLSSLKWVKRGL